METAPTWDFSSPTFWNDYSSWLGTDPFYQGEDGGYGSYTQAYNNMLAAGANPLQGSVYDLGGSFGQNTPESLQQLMSYYSRQQAMPQLPNTQWWGGGPGSLYQDPNGGLVGWKSASGKAVTGDTQPPDSVADELAGWLIPAAVGAGFGYGAYGAFGGAGAGAGEGLTYGTAPELLGEGAGWLNAAAPAAGEGFTYGTAPGLLGELGTGGAIVDSAGPLFSTTAQQGGLLASIFGPENAAAASQWLKLAGPAMSIYSGLSAQRAGNNLSNLGQSYGAAATPFDSSGSRALANSQLQALMNNPTLAAQNDPAYKLRMQAAMRAMAPMGQRSGAMAQAAADASTSWYNDRLAQLGQLAGAGFSPAAGGQLALQGATAGAGLQSQGQASLGYGVTQLGNILGGTDQNTLNQILISRMLNGS
jgi:hypothetical protein